jgi:4-amino-4-deoxychorismate lyase
MTRATLLSLTKPTSAPAAPASPAAPAGPAGDKAAAHPDAESGFVAVDASAPQVNLMDLGLTRGDGVFETISVVNGHAQALEPHLQRLAHSAALLDLPEPDLDVWRRAVLAGVERYGLENETALENDSRPENGTAPELYAKLILTRGVEGTRQPSGWVFVDEAGTRTT